MECGDIFAWTRGRRAYIKAHAKIPWMSFPTKNKAYVKLVKSNIPLQTRDDFKYSSGLRFCLRQRQKQLWKHRQTEENVLVFKLEHAWKKSAKSGDPRLHTGYVDTSFGQRTEQNNLLRMSVNNTERKTNKQTKRKQYIHQRFQASFLSSARTKSWMRTGWGHLMTSWILAGTASKK